MSPEFIIWSLTAASTASCLVGGVFLSFSDFTMRSLRLATPNAGTQAMQILNREVFRSIFIVLLIGLGPVTALIAALALLWPPQAGATLIILGSLSYVLGVFGVTIFGNVPKNERLASMPDGGAEAQMYWPTYYRGWMFWNHVRTVFSCVTSVCYIAAAIHLALAL